MSTLNFVQGRSQGQKDDKFTQKRTAEGEIPSRGSDTTQERE